MRNERSFWVLAGVLVCLSPASAPSERRCSIPVFRYALEHWPSEAYQAYVFHRGPLVPEAQASVERLRKSSGGPLFCNLEVSTVDLSAKPPDDLRKLWETQREASPPWVVVRYPDDVDEAPDAWAGRLSGEAADSLVNSAARREIVQRILKGESTVWVVLECGDRKRDDAAAELLQRELARLEKTLKLPEPTEDAPKLLAAIPLRIAFSVLRLPRDGADERALAGMLLKLGGDTPPSAGPIVFPVFGRGRVLLPLSEDRLKPETLSEVAEFLTGACSCEAKELNPGKDLLMSADWGALFAEATPEHRPAPPVPAPPRPAPHEPSPAETPTGASPRGLLWAGVIVASLLVAVTGARLLRSRARRAA